MADVVNFIILCHSSMAKVTQRLFPHESGIIAEPQRTASHSVDRIGMFVVYTLEEYKKNTHTQRLSLRGLSVLHMV